MTLRTFLANRMIAVLWLLLIAAAPLAAVAQESEQAGEQPPVAAESATEGAAEGEGETEGAPEPASVPVNLETPRGTLTTFLEAMNAVTAGREGEWPVALSCLYLEDLPEEDRQAQGQELATRLFEVLDSVTINFDQIPEESETRNVDVEVGGEPPVPLYFRLNDDGKWRFSRSRIAETLDEVHQEVVAEAEAAEVSDARVNPDLSNPRRTMRTFLEAMGQWDEGGREKALSTLDLSEVGESVREDKGATAATLLKRVMDRDRVVIYQEIPNDPRGGRYVHLVDRSDPQNELKIEIVPQPVDEEGDAYEWRFSAETVADAEALWDMYKDRPLVTGTEEDSPRILSIQLRDWVSSNYPFLMERTVFLENWQWLGLLAIVLLGMIISRLFGFLLIRVIRQVFNREQLKLDVKLERDFVRPIRISVMAWVWWFALRPLGLPANALALLKSAAATLSALAAVWAVYRLVDILGGYLSEKARKTENKFDDLVVPLVVRSLKVFVFVFGILFIAEVNDWDYRTALAGVGLGGLAFALAARDTIGNVFGSLTILLDKPFQIGDWINLDGMDGTVESVGMRSTRIRTFYNSLMSVPNSIVMNTKIDNFGLRQFRRTSTTIALTYDTPPEKIEAFCEGVRELIRCHPYTRKDYYHVYLSDFGEHSLNILLYCFHECPDWSTELRERHRLYLDIIRLAHRLGVEFAFPTQTLHVQPMEGANGRPPTDLRDPVTKGQREASAIVEATLGKHGAVPPPVAFHPSAPPDEAFQRQRREHDNV